MTRHDIQGALLNYLARREYSRQELTQRLLQRGADAVELECCLDELIERGYQSDRRFSQLALRDRAQRGYGPAFIRQWLYQKGVPACEIDRALHDAEQDWYQVAVETLSRKLSRSTRNPDTLRLRQFLYRRGFDSDQIRHALEEVREHPDVLQQSELTDD